MSSQSPILPNLSAHGLPANWPELVLLKDTTVNVSGLSGRMVLFLTRLSEVHEALFDTSLVVTSGNDGGHTTNSKHSQNKAVDIRCVELAMAQQIVFLACINLLAPGYSMAVFDERALPGASHIHIEEAG